MQILQRFVSSTTLTLAGAALAHAGVITVGGGNAAYPDIPEAVAAAVDGDVILVRDGSYSYSPFTIDGKAISVIADAGVPVFVDSTATVRNLPAGKTVVLKGLTITNVFSGPSMLLENNAGHVRVESIVASTLAYALGSTFEPVRVLQCADVSFASCIFQGPDGTHAGMGYVSGGTEGLSAANSKVSLYDCTLSGGSGHPGYTVQNPHNAGPGAPAFRGLASTLFARGSSFSGGNGGQGFSGGVPAPICTTPYQYPTYGGAGGPGILLQGSLPLADVVACTLTGGAGGLGGSSPCATLPQGPAGQPFVAPAGSVTTQPGPTIRFGVPQPAREGGIIALHFEGVPGQRVVLVLGNGGAGYQNVPALHGILLVAPSLRRFDFGTIPPSGVLDVNLPVPLDLGPGVQSRLNHVQAVFIDPISGTHLAAPGVVIMIDSAF